MPRPGCHPAGPGCGRTLPDLDQPVREAVVLAMGRPDEAMSSLEFDWQFRTGGSAEDGVAAWQRFGSKVG